MIDRKEKAMPKKCDELLITDIAFRVKVDVKSVVEEWLDSNFPNLELQSAKLDWEDDLWEMNSLDEYYVSVRCETLPI